MKRKTFSYPPPVAEDTQVLREALVEEVAPRQINVRAAKDSLSSLLEEASRGREIIITSDGKPKAKLVSMQPQRKRFKVDWELLKGAAATAGPNAEQLIREERDGRP